MEKSNIPLGTIEIYGTEAKNRNFVYERLKEVYETFGFEPLQTPTFEFKEVFTGHHGEGENLLFHLQDVNKQDLVLRYDMTVPFARFATEHPELKRPIKRYQMQLAYRDDSIDKGHLREFMQCDGDIIGSRSLYYDADVINLAVCGLKQLGFSHFIIRINHRKIIKGIAEELGYMGKSGLLKVQRALDCADKFGKSEASIADFTKKLTERGFSEFDIERINKIVFKHYHLNNPDELFETLYHNPSVKEGIKELQEILSYLPEDITRYCELDLTLARGADYYTGFILEGILPQSNVGAILGGGRYDNLVKDLGGTDVGCVGMAFGLDRIWVAMQDMGLYPPRTDPKILIFTTDKVDKSIFELANHLRSHAVNTDICCEFKDYAEAEAYARSRDFTGIIWDKKYHSLVKWDEHKKFILSLIK